MTVILKSLPRKKRIGMAFSGGLDTSAALLWMRMRKATPHAFVADVGQPHERDQTNFLRQALLYGAETAILVDCRTELVRQGLSALQCRAFHQDTAGNAYFNTTPLSRAVMGIMLVSSMDRKNIGIWGDGSTHKGNDIERFYRYGFLANPDVRLYKPWLDAQFTRALGGRREIQRFLFVHGFRWNPPRNQTYSIDANILGVSYEGEKLEKLNSSVKDVHPIMGIKFWKAKRIDPRTIRITFDEGFPVSVDGRFFRKAMHLLTHLNDLGGRHGFGMSDQIEDRITKIKSRGIYEAPGMLLLHIAYERLMTGIHGRDAIVQYRRNGAFLGRLLYHGKWFDPQSWSVRDATQRWVAREISGTVAIELRCGNDYSILNTESNRLLYKRRYSTMEQGAACFSSADRIGQLNVKKFDSIHACETLRRWVHRKLLRRKHGVFHAPTDASNETTRSVSDQIEAFRVRQD